MALAPVGYEWLYKVGTLPKMVSTALELYGTTEKPGKANDPEIMKWATEIGEDVIGWKYKEDSIPWCGLFIAIVAKRAGKPIPKGPLYALNWSKFGTLASTPVLGDVLTFKREGGGHVGLYIGEDADCYHVLGGNQGDKVCITRIQKSRLYQARRVPVKTRLPKSAKKFTLKSTGLISVNEA